MVGLAAILLLEEGATIQEYRQAVDRHAHHELAKV